MKWNDLSNEAKSIIEWIENPYTRERLTIEIKLNKEFIFPASSESVMVTKNIYDEVLQFVTDDANLQCQQFADSLIFKIKDDSKLKLH